MADDHAHALPKGHRIEEYEIVRVLGAGGFGITYLAFDHKLDGPVALKEYFPTEFAVRASDHRVVASSTGHKEVFAWGLDRFIGEARAIHRFTHPNVVRVLRYVEANGTAYIVMEHVDGESLAVVLNARGRLTPEQWRPWFEALLDGLAHVHASGYLHRDIKPSNIMVRAADGEPVLIDFGSARVSAAERTHTQVLSRAYAPYEQYLSKAVQGPFTDIYSLAAVSYRVLAGESPPSAPDRKQDGQYDPLVERASGADPKWLASIDRGLAMRPENRPQTVAAWGAMLADSLGDARRLAAWYQRAADDGDVEAQFNLGCMYESGEGLPQDYATAATWYRKAADRGEADAQFNLGCLYDAGKGVPQDHIKAAAWFRKAADQEHVDAQFNLALLLMSGQGVPKDCIQAALWLHKAADQGDAKARSCLTGKGVPKEFAQAAAWYCEAVDENDPKAQGRLGCMYADGEGVPQSKATAATWFRKAADQGDPVAQFYLALAYATGVGVPVDAAQAAAWSRSAADQGFAPAQTFLGLHYRSGKDVPPDYARAAEWFQKAADQDYADAQYFLAGLCESGEGVPADAGKAYSLYDDAAEGGNANAQYRIGQIYADFGMQEKAAEWIQKAADQDHAAAAFFLGVFSSTLGLPEDEAKAEAWLRKAADNGHPDAQFLIGMGYRSGNNAPQDDMQAAAWLRKAADQGHTVSQCELGDMYVVGTGVPKDLVEAHTWLTIASATAAASDLGESAVNLRVEIDGKRQAIEADMTSSEIAEANRRARAYMESSNRESE